MGFASLSQVSILAQAATTVDLLKLIPDGLNVVGVIVVIVLFLNQQNKYNVALKDITKSFEDRITTLSTSYQTQIDRAFLQISANQKEFQDQVRTIMDQSIRISQQSISTMKSLEALIRERLYIKPEVEKK